MNKEDNTLAKMEIHMDIMVERMLLMEHIQNMKQEHLWRMLTYARRFQEIEKEQELPLPIGVSSYCEASTSYYYVDK